MIIGLTARVIQMIRRTRRRFLATVALAAILAPCALAQNVSISIAKVDGLYRADTLLAGADVRLVLRFNNATDMRFALSNGFVISSPDAADWLDARLDTIAPNPGGINAFRAYFDEVFQLIDRADGLGNDSLALLAAGSGTSMQLPSGFNDTCLALFIDMPSSPTVNIGRHICIDSGFLRPGTYWEWYASIPGCFNDIVPPEFLGLPGQSYTPGWGYCFPIKNPLLADLKIAASRARPDYRKLFVLQYENLSGQPLTNTQVVLSLPSGVYYQSSTPVGLYSAGSHSVTWLLGPLSAGAKGTLYCTGTVSGSQSAGDTLISTAVFSGLDPSTAPFSLTASEREVVVTTWDANDKQAWPTGSGPSHQIHLSDTLHYQVNFQNPGPGAAVNVTVRDTLSPYLDEGTLVIGVTSHACTYQMIGREMIWIFSNINLPDSTSNPSQSFGFVTFRAQPRQDLEEFTFIANRASVYFDAGPPIVTNTIEHQIIFTCCTGTTGNVNMAGIVDGGDLALLVAYLTNAPGMKPTLPCPAEANVNAAGIIDGGDLALLVAYLTNVPGQKPTLPNCP